MPNGATATLENFVADFGEEFRGHKRPRNLRVGPKKKCFGNAADLATGNKRYEYVEGYVRGPPISHFLHAWCVSGDRVVDPTLEDPENYEYLGVRVPTRLLISILAKQKHYGLFTGSCGEEFMTDWSNSHSPFPHGPVKL
jgi:hypothetical protein